MAKTRTVYICQQCGAQQAREMGRCPNCGNWGSLVEQVERREGMTSSRRSSVVSNGSAPQQLPHIPSGGVNRLPVRFQEFARVLGGGLVPGSLVLIGGEPGIGKSSLLLQSAAHFAENVGPALYISAEESAQQIKLRADRMGLSPEHLWVSSETNLEVAIQHILEQRPGMVIVDSIQTIYLEELSSAAGSVGQVREGALRLLRIAKDSNIPIIIVGHVTKEGAIAGPRMLEHIVDVVLYLEGERFHQYRVLRGVKNRFGSTDEVGIFEMTADGLQEITNPSQVFLAERSAHTPGSAVAVTLEGTRPILVEVQGLTSNTANPQPRRTVNGFDNNRLQMILAVLGKRVGVPLFNQDVYINIVGGLKIGEPAADLAVATAIASSFRNQAVEADMVLIGEIGLSGELRGVSQLERRIGEAAKLGFRRVVCPPLQSPLKITGMQITPARSLYEAIDSALGPAPRKAARAQADHDD
jgi:DNA repair protein RadA/Sms